METNDDAGGLTIDSMQPEALSLNAIDQLIIGKALQGSDVLDLYSSGGGNALLLSSGLCRA